MKYKNEIKETGADVSNIVLKETKRFIWPICHDDY